MIVVGCNVMGGDIKVISDGEIGNHQVMGKKFLGRINACLPMIEFNGLTELVVISRYNYI
jgi:hypothetical protein